MTIRKTCVFILFIFCSFSFARAQQAVFDEYSKEAGDYAALYSGKVEVGYSPYQYINHPYLDTDEFQEGTICFNGQLYSGLKMRYDTYKKWLAVITPEKRIVLQVDMRKVDYFTMGDKKFIPQDGNFVALLYESEQMRLTQHTMCGMGVPVEKGKASYRNFKQRERFNLHKEGTDYTVSSRSGFIKLFPDNKKELKKFAKEQRLDFKAYRAESLTLMTKYADSLNQ